MFGRRIRNKIRGVAVYWGTTLGWGRGEGGWRLPGRGVGEEWVPFVTSQRDSFHYCVFLRALFSPRNKSTMDFSDHVRTLGSHPHRRRLRLCLGCSPCFIHMHNAARWCFPDSFFPPAGPESHLRLKRFQLLSFPPTCFTCFPPPPTSQSNRLPKQRSAKQEVERWRPKSFR